MVGAALSAYVLAQDQQKVFYDHYQNGHDKVVIIAHGFFNSKDALLLKELGRDLARDYDVIIMDFRGHGRSPGVFFWTTKEYMDLKAVLDYARQKYTRVGVIGFSLGAATTLITAAQFPDDIDTVIAVSPPVDFKRIEYHFWEMDVENDIWYSLVGEGRIGKGVRPGPFWFTKLKPTKCVTKIKCPVFYMHGDADWLIKPWHSQSLYDRTPGHKRLAIIKNGPHAEYLIRKNKQEVMGLIHEWLRETL